MIFEGTVHAYGRDVDTDVIIPARYLNSSDPAELGAHCMEDIDPDFVARVRPGDIIVAARELRLRQLARARPASPSRRPACRASSPPRLPASSTATPSTPACRSWSVRPPRPRRAPATGCASMSSPAWSTNLTQGTSHQADAFPAFMQELIAQGGLLPYVKARLARRGRGVTRRLPRHGPGRRRRGPRDRGRRAARAGGGRRALRLLPQPTSRG